MEEALHQVERAAAAAVFKRSTGGSDEPSSSSSSRRGSKAGGVVEGSAASAATAASAWMGGIGGAYLPRGSVGKGSNRGVRIPSRCLEVLAVALAVLLMSYSSNAGFFLFSSSSFSLSIGQLLIQ
jgi:hypothetical protein